VQITFTAHVQADQQCGTQMTKYKPEKNHTLSMKEFLKQSISGDESMVSPTFVECTNNKNNYYFYY